MRQPCSMFWTLGRAYASLSKASGIFARLACNKNEIDSSRLLHLVYIFLKHGHTTFAPRKEQTE